MKENKEEILAGVIFLIVGMVFMLVGIIFGISKLNYNNKVNTTGVITEISSYRKSNGDRKYDVYVSYLVNGIEYNSKLGGYSSGFYEGKEIEIYYDKDNPTKIGTKSIDFLFIIFLGMGTVFVIIGGILIYQKVYKRRLRKKLKENGETIYASYVETVLNTVYSVNGRNPYNVICEWNNTIDGKKYLFRSQNIWENPENIIREKNIETFPVYINPNKIKQYVVDIDEIVKDIVDLT